VFGILPDRAGKRLLLLLVESLQDHERDSGWSFSMFKAGLLSLETLEPAAAAFPRSAPAPEVLLCVSEKGTPLWVTKTGYTVDVPRKKLVETAEVCPAGSGVKVTRDRGQHVRLPAAGVAVDVGRKQFTIDGAQEVRRQSEIEPESIGWSPAKTHLVFADEYRNCDLWGMYPQEEAEWPASARKALLVWDVAARKAVRVAEAFSFFEWEWVDGDHLAHETGSRMNPRVAVYEISTGTETTIETRHGAGLVAVPTSACTYATAEEP
jgi:hypothetical protein